MDADPIRCIALPLLTQRLSQARQSLALAQGHPNEAALLATRLAPDMLCLAHQVQVLADGVQGAFALLSGDTLAPAAARVFNRAEELLGRPDASLAQADARLAAALAQPCPPILRDGELVVVRRPGHAREFAVADFVWRYVLPNTIFHATLAHALLRHAGVPVGKADFEGAPVYRRVD